jgi:hypothetical protein
MEQRGPHPGQIEELIGRLDALTTRLDQQATVIAVQQAEIERLRATPTLAAPIPVAKATPDPVEHGRSATSNRRAAITRVLGATAAGALLALAKQPDLASADYRGTATGGGASTPNFGIAAIPGAGVDPTSLAVALGTTAHGVVGTLSTSPPSPTFNSGVLGLGVTATQYGVQGLSTDGVGTYGRSNTSFGAIGITASTIGGFAGVSGTSAGATGATFGVSGTTSSNTNGAVGVSGLALATSGIINGVQGETKSTANSSNGVFGLASATNGATNGVQGETKSSTSTATGVFGLASASSGITIGTWGRSTSSDSNAIGVFGEVTASGAPGTGVKGISPNGPGVFGTSTTAFGVQGLSSNAFGVSGNSTSQAGVWGSSNTNVGVLGTSIGGVGVIGVSQTSNGVNGVTTSGIAIFGSSGGTGQAGRFDGNVVINGNLTVTGTFPTSIAVSHPDGSLRRMYGMESPDAYFEDVGQGSITAGVGHVTIDPDFAALVMGDTYHVFLTPRGDCRGLYISAQDANGFDVREVQGGTSSVGFSYRMVARPKDVAKPRLDRVDIPAAPPQPDVVRTEPLNVDNILRNQRQPDKPVENSGGVQPARTRD